MDPWFNEFNKQARTPFENNDDNIVQLSKHNNDNYNSLGAKYSHAQVDPYQNPRRNH